MKNDLQNNHRSELQAACRAVALSVMAAIFWVAGNGLVANAQSGDCNTSAVTERTDMAGSSGSSAYILGPRDKLAIHVLDEDELGQTPYAIDLNGNIVLPRVGSVHVAGLTIPQVEAKLTRCFGPLIRKPVVTVSITEYSSQPVTVLGAVAKPGIRQIEGKKNLFEIISEAGGLKEEAGNTIQITRRLDNGPLPLANAHPDSTGKFSIGDVSVRSIVRGENPGENIPILPYDVITVPRAEMVYVVGAVNKSGGFTLSERSQMSVLELLSLAQGMDKTAGGKNARILRASENTDARVELPIDLNKIIKGKSPDVNLRGNDILFVPNSTGKAASLRMIEAILSTGSGVAMYHPY